MDGDILRDFVITAIVLWGVDFMLFDGAFFDWVKRKLGA